MKNWIKGYCSRYSCPRTWACSTPAEPKTDPETGKKVEIENKSKMTAQEVYEKAMAVSEEQKSMHAKMNIDQLIKIPSQEFEMNSKIKMDMDMVIEPLAMYQKMNVDMGEQGEMDMEMYMTEEGFFMNDPESGQWIKLPDEMYEEMIGQCRWSGPNTRYEYVQRVCRRFQV